MFLTRKQALKVRKYQECLNFNGKFGGGATIAMPRIRYLSAHANNTNMTGKIVLSPTSVQTDEIFLR